MRRFTLIELIVSLALISALLGLLMHFLYATTVVSNQIESELADEFSRSYLHLQLEPILSELVAPILTDPDSKSLSFSYFHGIDSQPTFCGEVFARLWLSRAGELILTTWPSGKQWGGLEEPVRSQLLATDVEELRFRFYLPHKPDDLSIYDSFGKHERIEGRPTGWFSSWNYEGLPAMVEVILLLNGEPVHYIFSPIHAHEPIVYYDGAP